MVDDDPANAHTMPGGTATPTQDTIIPTRHTPGPIATGTPDPRRNTPIPFGAHQPPPHYKIGELIGRGGMGEVIAAQDEHIGREVAIKRMRAANPDSDQLSRFLREARIQARLDHPAIVPVHELGTDPSGHPYFTMKRISGRTLAQHMHDGTKQQTLLRALVSVARAVALAHSKGVIHRDLKPSNIMLGDYDEVYVLDWGVARVLDEDETPSSVKEDISTLDEEGTQTGTMLGTPGYMAPEMIKGEAAYRPADVYALGAILFEILTQAPLHPRGTAAIAATLHMPQEWPRRRTDKTIPLELDQICFLALSEQPHDRQTAQKLADQLQSFLDGDRDVEARKKQAAEQLQKARDALAKGGDKARADAILRAGRAMSLDPELFEAAELVTELTIKPPVELPPELAAELQAEETKLIATRSKAGFFSLIALFSFWIIIPFLGIKSWGWLCLAYAAVALHTAYVYRGWRSGTISIPLGLVSALIFVTFISRIGGLMIITPILMCGLLIGFTSSSIFMRHRWLIPAWSTVAFLLPIGLEHFHLMPDSWQVTLDSIISRSSVFEMQGWYADAALVACNIVCVIVVGTMAANVHYAAKVARRKLTIQNWHMNKLVPSERRPWNTAPGRDSMPVIPKD
ncbi:MAG TPA: bifunctional serine/threonine protein kinase/MFS transporter [Kofleriaceae bacterium]|jgi:serine/threonine-protein kinase